MTVSSLPLVVLGAGGHAKSIVDAALAAGMVLAGLLAPEQNAASAGAGVIGSDDLLEDGGFLRSHLFLLGMGDQQARRRMIELLEARGARFAIVVHPRAGVSSSATLGDGTVVLSGAVTGPASSIGRHCVVNTLAGVDHDCELGENVMVSPHAALCGGVSCRNDVFIGAGAVLLPGAAIGDRSFIAAGEIVAGNCPPDSRISSGRVARFAVERATPSVLS